MLFSDEDSTECQILGPSGFVVQFIMGFLSFLVLLGNENILKK